MTTKQPAPQKTAAAARRRKPADAEIDAVVERARGKPGYPLVRLFGDLAKLGPYDFKKHRGGR